MAIRMKDAETKMQPMLERLEEMVELIHEQRWAPLTVEGPGGDDVYQGEILGFIYEDTPDEVIMTIGQVTDRDDADIICAAVNNLQDLLSYVRYLERKCERLAGNRIVK